MNRSNKRRRIRPIARSFLDSLHEFLTPAIWKQAHGGRGRSKSSRWDTQPLVLCLLMMTWCCGDSQVERFETAKGLTAVCLNKRRRPGRTVQGFQKALAQLPMPALRAVAAGLRRLLQAKLDLRHQGFIALGCDGSSMSCPRTRELEKRLDASVKGVAGAPQVWVTALVHLRSGLLWSWCFGKGHNRERSHLRRLLTTLPASALLVADPGFNGYDLARTLTAAGVSYLIRMSGKDRLYTLSQSRLEMEAFEEGELLSWPDEARRAGLPPQRVRLVCIRRRDKRDVWLLTNVLDAERLTREMAGRYYRQRWENEGLFRTYKQTLKKMKLTSRTVRLVHREAEGSMIALQILLAIGASSALAEKKPRDAGAPTRPRVHSTASRSQPSTDDPSPRPSPRKLLLAIRKVCGGQIGVRDTMFGEELDNARQEHRPDRTSRKEARAWPTRAPYRATKPPICRPLSTAAKALAEALLGHIT